MKNIHESVFVAAGARIVGDVTIGENSSVWFNAVLRGDSDKIVVGKNTNIQDLALLHVDGGMPCIVGDNVTIGHSAIVHACTVEDDALIGMGATVLHKAHIGKGAMIGAGALVKMGQVVEPYSLYVGVPAKKVRDLTPEDIEHNKKGVEIYLKEAELYKKNGGEI